MCNQVNHLTNLTYHGLQITLTIEGLRISYCA